MKPSSGHNAKPKFIPFKRISEPVTHEDNTQSWRFEVSCGKGTYVRTLAVDTGKLLGVPAHMSDLTRLKSGGFSKEESYTIAEVQKAVDEQRVSELLLPLEYGYRSLFK